MLVSTHGYQGVKHSTHVVFFLFFYFWVGRISGFVPLKYIFFTSQPGGHDHPDRAWYPEYTA